MEFGDIFDKMNRDYEKLETLMSYVYSREGNSDMIMYLGEIAERMIDTQIAFTDSYCKDNFKNSLMDNLYSKRQALEDSLNNEISR